MQTDVWIAGEPLGERPQPFHESSGNARVGLLHDAAIDVRRAAYVGHWMTLALEEAKKIDHQRRSQRRLTTHRMESIVNGPSDPRRRRIYLGSTSLFTATVLVAAEFSHLLVVLGLLLARAARGG